MSDKKREPAIQNIPLRTETGRGIREAFVRREGSTFGESDFSGLEKRFAEQAGLPLTEWQCVECAHVNEKATGVCDDCGEPYETTRKADREMHG